MISFAHPVWLLLLPVLLVWGWLALRRGLLEAEPAGAARLTLLHPDLSPLPTEKLVQPASSRWPQLLQLAALLLMIVALAQPQHIGEMIPEKPEGREIVLLIDTSRTMSIDDFELGGQRVERLAVLKSVVSRFVEQREGDRFGVIVFGSTAATMVPPSFDRDLVSGMVKQVQVGIAGDNTALGDAIGLALKHLHERQALRPALILFSDNTDNNAGAMTPTEAVELARHMGVAIYTVQIGSDLFAEGRVTQAAGNSEPDMAQIAALTGGRYYRADSSGGLQNVVEDIGKLEKTITRPSTRRQVEEWYAALLWLAVLLLSLARVLQIRKVAA
jgi:Ca-activated chloride channel homolog